MPNNGHYWTKAETKQLLEDFQNRKPWESKTQFYKTWVIGREMSYHAAESKLNALIAEGLVSPGQIKESPYPVYNEPLHMVGDALVLGDVEFPFHHAEFLNACLELAARWGIRQLILAGDVLHFDSLSTFDPAWKNEKRNAGGLSEDDEMELRSVISSMSPNSQHRKKLEATLEQIGRREEQDGVSTELDVARRNIQRLADSFDLIDFVIGNHEGRFLRAMESPIMPSEILRQLELTNSPKWRIAPFYYSTLESAGEVFRATHPKNSSKGASRNLAAKFHQHILMAHNHHWLVTSDRSGKYLAAEIGCCVDEERLPYAAQRDNGGDAHVLGAAIVRNGKAWFLNKFTDWDALLKL